MRRRVILDPPLGIDELASREFTPRSHDDVIDHSDGIFVLAAPTISNAHS